MPAHVVAQHLKPRQQGGHLGLPHLKSGAERVAQHQDRGVFVAFKLVMNRDAVDFGQGHVYSIPSKWQQVRLLKSFCPNAEGGPLESGPEYPFAPPRRERNRRYHQPNTKLARSIRLLAHVPKHLEHFQADW